MSYRYRVEFQRTDGDGRTYVLGVLTGRTPTARSFDPYVSRLLNSGMTGVLKVVDAETGEAVARRWVRPAKPPRKRASLDEPIDGVDTVG